MKKDNVLIEDVFPFLPQVWGRAIERACDARDEQLTEMRLRVGRTICLRYGLDEVSLKDYVVTGEDLEQIVSALCHHSRYAMERELRAGYITIRGGHRVGLAGQAVVVDGKVRLLKEISSVAIRIAREVIGAADGLLPYVYSDGQIVSTLLVAPPYAGKTTVLRDLVRQLSDGSEKHRGVQVGIADERSEIAGIDSGRMRLSVGVRTDVIDGASKAEAMMMLIRAMSPMVIATDELGRKEDFVAVEEAVHAGIAVIATLHGRNWQDVTHRMGRTRDAVLSLFGRVVFLTNQPSMGTIREVVSRP